MADEAPETELQQALQKAERSGFGVRSWADVHNLMFVGIMLLGCIGWGLKLEWRIDAHQAQFEALKLQVAAMDLKVEKGILPITAVELNVIKEKLGAIHEEIFRLQSVISAIQANQMVYRQNEIIRQSDEQANRNVRRSP